MPTYPVSASSSLIFTATAQRVKLGAAAAGISFRAMAKANPHRTASANIVFTATAARAIAPQNADHGTGAEATAVARTTAVAAATGIVLSANCGTGYNNSPPVHLGVAHAQIVFGASCSATTQSAAFSVQATTGIVFAARATSKVQIGALPGDLNTVLGSGYSTHHPFSYAPVPFGILLLTNGIDPMLRWDSATGILEVAGCPAPLSTQIPSIQVEGTASTTASLIYAYVRFVDTNGNLSDLSPVSAPATSNVNPVTQAIYTNVPLPTGPYFYKVARRQLLRNTPGQGTTWYVDLDTPDLSATSFISTTNDTTLQTQTAVPLLATTGAILANIHGFPPSTKVSCAMQQGRAFMAGEVSSTDGSCIVTTGSTTVQGVGTHWPVSFQDRTFFVTSPAAEYPIQSVDPVAQTLTLKDPYVGPTDHFCTYGIRADRSQWRLVYYSAPLAPESWPSTYALSVQEDGDEITGLMQVSSFLYILERRHIYRVTFQNDPAADGGIFLASNRGCLTNRTWVMAEDTVYMLDEMGIHSFASGSSTPISEPIQDLFRDNSDSPLRVNWDADPSLWHASYSEVHGTVRFFVSMTGTNRPRHAICYNYRENRWWLEEYKRPILSSTRVLFGEVRTFAGTDANQIVALDQGYYEGTRCVKGTLFNPCTGIQPCGLTDSNAQFQAEVIGLNVTMYTGPAKGQSRRIVGLDPLGFTLQLKTPWTIGPEVGDDYMIGAIEWHWRGGWFVFSDDAEGQAARDVEVVFTPLTHGVADLELFYNYSDAPRTWTTERTGTATVIPGDPRVEIDLTDPASRGVFRAEGHRERYIDGDRFICPQLGGYQHGEKVKIQRLSINGVEQEQ